MGHSDRSSNTMDLFHDRIIVGRIHSDSSSGVQISGG
jgi:hypothetical protein